MQQTVETAACYCWDLLSKSAKIDRIIKGAHPGNGWSELQQLTLHMAGSVILKLMG